MIIEYAQLLSTAHRVLDGKEYIDDSGNRKVKSKANRMVIMNSKVKHYGTNSTDCTNRMVINFNYF